MPADEQYYGLGEKAGPLGKRGHSYVMWNTDPAAYNATTDPMYQSIPFFIALRKRPRARDLLRQHLPFLV
jgi:alpha-glucosidase